MTPERIEEIAGNYAQKHNEYPHLSALQVIKEAIAEAVEEEKSRFWAIEKVFTDIAKYLGVQQGDVPGLLEEITNLKESAGLNCDDIKRLCLALSWMGYSTPEGLGNCCAVQVSLMRDLISAVLDLKKRKQEDRGEPIDPLKLEELIDRTRREERKRMWEQINNHIKEGKLAGNGFDKTAERNGLIHAANIIWSFGI